MPTIQITPTSTGGSLSSIVVQNGHGFTVGALTPVRRSSGSWVASEADTAAHADVQAAAVAADANTFTLYQPGSHIAGLTVTVTADADYFLSPSSAGAITTTEPSTAGQVSAPLGVADTTTSFYFEPLRGLVIPAKATFTPIIPLLLDATALATGEDFSGVTFPITSDLNGWSLTAVKWVVATVSSSGLPSLGVRKNSTEMLTTNVTIDVSETSSETAATAAVIKSDGSQTVATGDIVHFDCDVAGTGTKGSYVIPTFTAP